MDDLAHKLKSSADILNELKTSERSKTTTTQYTDLILQLYLKNLTHVLLILI